MSACTAFLPSVCRVAFMRKVPLKPTTIVRGVHSRHVLECASVVGVKRRRVWLMSSEVDEKNETYSETSSDKAVSPSQQPFPTAPRYDIAALYVGFVVFALFLAPGSLSDPGEIGRILSGNFDGTNDLFFSIFNLLGISSVNYAALLNAGAPRQSKLTAEYFTIMGIFLGFFAVGPYLVARDYVPDVSAEEVAERSVFSRILESKWFHFGSLLFAIWIYAFSFGAFTPGTQEFRDVVFYASGTNLVRLAMEDRSVAVSCADFVLLSILTWGPLTEDMSRRGWFTKGKERDSVLTALSFLLAPVLGTTLYLVTRPPLPPSQKRDPIK